MTHLRALGILLVLLVAAAPEARAQRVVTPGAAAGRPTGAIPGELLVGFERRASGADRAAARRAARVSVKRGLRLGHVQLVKVERGSSERDAIRALERQKGVRFAERNRYRQPAARPNDPLLGQLWGLDNSGQIVDGVAGLEDKDIDALGGWEVLTGGQTLVAVVDEGIAYDHPDLAPNMWRNPGETPGNGVDDDGNGHVDDVHGIDTVDADSDPRDLGGHGSHVAGTIAAVGDNGQGITGVAWSARLMAVRALGPTGGSDATVAEAFDYAGDMGAQIVNASLGGPGSSQTLQDAISAHPGTLFVVAAGNGGDDGVGDDNDSAADPNLAQFPCNYPDAHLICVAATDQADELAGFSNFGTTSVDVAAPGTSILSAALDRGKVVLSDGFEGAGFLDRWVPNGSGAGWNRTSEAAAGGSFSAGDSPGRQYANSSASYLDTEIDVAGESGCVLDFALEADLAPGDQFLVYRNLLGPDGWAGWGVVGSTNPATGADTGGSFIAVSGLELGNDGASRMALSFGVETDASGTADGVHVDDVVVRCVQPETGAGDYVFLQGTSMATPHVAGAAALLLARNPELSVAQARRVLLESGDALPSLAGAIAPAAGAARRLNLQALLTHEELGPVNPLVSTGAASGVDRTGATLSGTVDPRGTETSYRFDYGPTARYGSRTPVQPAGAGSGAQPVAAALSGLTAGTTYHYRLVAVRGGVEYVGADARFTTAAPDPGDTGGGTGGTATDPGAATPVTPGTGTDAGTTPVAPAVPLLPASVSGTARALKKRVKAARVRCANSKAGVTCKVTFRGAKRKRRVSAALRDGSRTVAKGRVRRANARGVVTIKGAEGVQKGAYSLSVKVGRTTYKFKVRLG